MKELDAGLMNEVLDGDTVEIIGQPKYLNGNLIYQAIQKRAWISVPAANGDWCPMEPRTEAQSFEILIHGKIWNLIKH